MMAVVSDAICCGHGITAERAALLEFPRPFAIFVESVLVRSDAIVTEPSDLSGPRIAAITAPEDDADVVPYEQRLFDSILADADLWRREKSTAPIARVHTAQEC